MTPLARLVSLTRLDVAQQASCAFEDIPGSGSCRIFGSQASSPRAEHRPRSGGATINC